jgi:hypothetical protein
MLFKMKMTVLILVVGLLTIGIAFTSLNVTYAGRPDPLPGRGNGAIGEVYVTSQGLYYDTFVTVDPLPYKGRFQRLYNGQTEFGPGDPGYLGGRWWVDDGDNVMEPPEDGEDSYILCPLLPPGREEPQS